MRQLTKILMIYCGKTETVAGGKEIHVASCLDGPPEAKDAEEWSTPAWRGPEASVQGKVTQIILLNKDMAGRRPQPYLISYP